MAPSIVQVAVSLLCVGSAWANFDSRYAVVLDKRAASIPTTLPGTWTYQGCYTDPGPRTLAGPSYVNTTGMTDESCIKYCDGLGYLYAGTEYSQECYCGNTIGSQGTVAPTSDCSMTCSGNSSEICGAGNRLSVFWNGKTPPAGPSTNPGTLGYGFFGCYTEGTTGRALTTSPSVTGGASAMTVALCISACKNAGYTYAGVEYAQECYCDNSIQNSAVIAPGGLSDCNMLCAANSTEYCGAGNRLDIYKLGYTGVSTASSQPLFFMNGAAAVPTFKASIVSSSKQLSPPTSVSNPLSTTIKLLVPVAAAGGVTFVASAKVAATSSSFKPTPSSKTSSIPLKSSSSSEFSSVSLESASSSVFSSSRKISTSIVTSMQEASTNTSLKISSSTSSKASSVVSSTSIKTTASSSVVSMSKPASSSSKSSSKLSSSTSVALSSSKISSVLSTTTRTSSSSIASSSSKSSSSSITSSSKLTSASSTGLSSSSRLSTSSTGAVSSSKSTSGSSSTHLTISSSSISSSTSIILSYSSSLSSSISSQSSFVTSSIVPSTSTALSSLAPSLSSSTLQSISTVLSSSSSPSLSSSIFQSTSTAVSSSFSSLQSTLSSSTLQSTSATNSLSLSSLSSSILPSSTTVLSSLSSSQSILSSSTLQSSSTILSSALSSSTSLSTAFGSSSIDVSASTSTFVSSAASSSPVISSLPNLAVSSSAAPSPTGYTYYACYTEGNGVRALTPGAFAADTMTVESCAISCAGYTYFGVEYGRECYCGNSIAASAVVAPATDCNMPCMGNSNELCGAGNRLNMYIKSGTATPTTTVASSIASGSASSSAAVSSQSSAATGLPAGWKYDGCYSEGINGRALQKQQPDSQTNSIESCIATCKGAGYTIAGMEFGVQCFCDNNLYNGAALVAASNCNMACPGAPSEICGNGNYLSVYNTGALTVYQAPAAQKTNLPGSWTYQGCYSDNVNNNRALFWQTILTNNNTATSCLTLCSNFGYMAAGMEYGDECYCGDDSVLIASGSTIQPETDCQVPCSGDSTYFCGGGSRLSYYKWTGTPLYTWQSPTGAAAGSYSLLIGGVVVPLITTVGINNKVVFMEKSGTGAPNTTGTYELDLAFINDFPNAWRPLHVKSDIFCSAGVTLPDKAGRQLNIGGWAGPSTHGVRLYWPDGSPGVPGVNDWQENVNEVSLIGGRWYPSAMIMTNGSVLVLGGEVGSNSAPTPSCEILPPPPGGYAKYLDWLDRTDPDNLYPFMFVLPTGGIFVVYYNEARIIDEGTFDTIKTLPNLPGSVNNFLAGRTYPLEGTGVMLPMYPPYSAPVTVLVCGGSSNGAAYAIDNCVSTQPEVASPTWTLERMPSQRVMSCICALPDGTYLILNGATEGVAGFGLATGPNLNAVLYDPSQPVNQRMSIMATTIVARLYHSEAVLMPDGRVMVSGSDPEDGTHPEEYRVEVFSPPYALSGLPAPSYTITTANKDWTYGSTYTVTANIPSGNLGGVRASMMAAVSSTHGNSMGQRTLFLSVACAGAANAATCSLTAPPTVHVAPPGWYQIFILDGPTPGPSQWIRIGGSIADAAGLGNWPNYADFKTPGLGAVGT